MIITAFNDDTSDVEKTYVSSYQNIGVTSLPVKNNNNFINGQPVLVGRMGSERSEIVTLTSVATNGLSIGVTATKFTHNADDPVYLLDFDKVRFYRSVGAGGTKSLVNEMLMDVDNAEKETRWDDAAALPTYVYYTTFYNSVTAEESTYSDPFQPGASNNNILVGTVIDAVVRRVRDTSYNVLSIQEYLDIAQEVNDDLITQAHRPYRFLKKPLPLDAVANQNYIALPTDLWKFDYIELKSASGNYNRYDEWRPMAMQEFNDRYNNNQTSPANNILEFAIDEETNQFLIYPTPQTAVTAAAIAHYYTMFPQIQDVGSVLVTPNTLIYRYKMMAEYYSAKSEVDKQWINLAQKYEAKYGNEVVKMQRANRLDTGTPRSFGDSYRRRRRYHL